MDAFRLIRSTQPTKTERLSEYGVSRFGDRSYGGLISCRLGRAEGETQRSTERIAKARGSVEGPNLEAVQEEKTIALPIRSLDRRFEEGDASCSTAQVLIKQRALFY